MTQADANEKSLPRVRGKVRQMEVPLPHISVRLFAPSLYRC